MKKVNFFLVKSLIMALVCFSVIACEKASERVTYYPISPVSKHETETTRTLMSHDNESKVREFKLYEEDNLTCTANVAYRADGIICTLNGIQYHIEPDNILGSTRAKKITATQDGALCYEVEYSYTDERLTSAMISAQGGPYYTSYTYYDSYIIINDINEYKLELCEEENTGNVCNVLGYAETTLTTQYVINPALYFLNIYGKPVEKLPHGCEITRSGKTMRVGKNLYEYRN